MEVSRKIVGDHAPSPEDGQVGDDTDGSEAANGPNESGEPENGEGRENEVNEVGRRGDHATRGDCRRKRGIAEFVIPIRVRFRRGTCLVFAFQRENLAKKTGRNIRSISNNFRNSEMLHEKADKSLSVRTNIKTKINDRKRHNTCVTQHRENWLSRCFVSWCSPV